MQLSFSVGKNCACIFGFGYHTFHNFEPSSCVLFGNMVSVDVWGLFYHYGSNIYIYIFLNWHFVIAVIKTNLTCVHMMRSVLCNTAPVHYWANGVLLLNLEVEISKFPVVNFNWKSDFDIERQTNQPQIQHGKSVHRQCESCIKLLFVSSSLVLFVSH